MQREISEATCRGGDLWSGGLYFPVSFVKNTHIIDCYSRRRCSSGKEKEFYFFTIMNCLTFVGQFSFSNT